MRTRGGSVGGTEYRLVLRISEWLIEHFFTVEVMFLSQTGQNTALEVIHETSISPLLSISHVILKSFLKSLEIIRIM